MTSSRATFDWVKGWEGVSFDLECFDDFVEHFENDVECGGILDRPVVPCLVFSGTRTSGQSCVVEWRRGPGGAGAGGLADGPCAGNRECLTGKCTSPPRPVVFEGEACNLGLGVRCDEGFYCGRDGTCLEEKVEGQPCDTPAACSSPLACIGLTIGSDAMGACAPRIAVGAPCDPRNADTCDGPQSYCSPATQTCEEPWPAVCELVRPPPDRSEMIDWIPE